MYKVYCCTDLENGYKYIGFTGLALEDRLRSHLDAAKYYRSMNAPFKVAIREGRKFKAEVIVDNIESLEEAIKLEKYFITKYRTYIGFEDCKGYNGTLGGEHSSPKDSRKFISVYDLELNFLNAIESTDKLAKEIGIDAELLDDDLNQGYIIIDDKLYVYSDKGIRNINIDKSIEEEKQLSMNSTFKINQGLGVNQYDKDGNFIEHFSCVEDAARALNTYGSSIIKVCKGKHHTHKEYIWRYSNDGFPIALDIEPAKTANYNARAVIQMDLDGNFIAEYVSAPEAYRHTGIAIGSIRKACTDMKYTAGGYKWAFKNIDDEIKHKRKVASYTLDGEIIKVYNSMMEAAKQEGIHRSCIYNCCIGRSKSSYGITWRYYSEEDNTQNDIGVFNLKINDIDIEDNADDEILDF